MRTFLRSFAIVCAFLMVSLAMGPARPDLVEEIEHHPTHLAMQTAAPKDIQPFAYHTDPELTWPGYSRPSCQYLRKKEPRPPRQS